MMVAVAGRLKAETVGAVISGRVMVTLAAGLLIRCRRHLWPRRRRFYAGTAEGEAGRNCCGPAGWLLQPERASSGDQVAGDADVVSCGHAGDCYGQ